MKIKLLDGATGTNLFAAGMPQGASVENWILQNKDALLRLQSAYVAAGADVIYAPTFGANPIALARTGGPDVRVNRELAALSKSVCRGTGCLVAGDLSPCGVLPKPAGDAPFEKTAQNFASQAAVLDDAGVDLFVIETSLFLAEALAAYEGVRSVSDKPVFVTFTVDGNCRTLGGETIEGCAVALQARGAAAFGVNCSDGGENVLKAVRRLRRYAKVPIIAKPNAGLPESSKGCAAYSETPAAFAAFCRELAANGASYIGGCCGTTPAHLAALGEDRPEAARFAPEAGVFATDGREVFAIDGGLKLPERVVCGENLMFDLPEPGEASCFRVFVPDGEALASLEETPLYGLPLCLDAANASLLEKAVLRYPGRCVIDPQSRLTKSETADVSRRSGAVIV